MVATAKQRAQARRDYQAAMSALEAYYKEYEDFIRRRGVPTIEEISGKKEMNRQNSTTTAKFNEDRQQLIKKFLGDERIPLTKTKICRVSSLTTILQRIKIFGQDGPSIPTVGWGDAMT